MSTSADARSHGARGDGAASRSLRDARPTLRALGLSLHGQTYLDDLAGWLKRARAANAGALISAGQYGYDEQLTREQFAGLARLISFWYHVMAILSVVYVFFNMYMFKSPFGYVVIAISEVCMIYRARRWRKISKNIDAYDLAAMKAEIHRTFLMALWMDGLCVLLTCGLLSDLSDEHKIVVVNLVTTSTIVTSFAFLIAPKVAFTELGVALVPMIIICANSHNMTLRFAAMQVCILGLAQIWMILRQFTDYRKIVESREQLQETQARLAAAEEAAREQAHTDSLTGLRNRRALDLLETAASRRPAQRLAAAVVDLDGFKNVNDSHGHAVGDELLKRVAERLRTQLSDLGEIIRMGGDEFALISQDEMWFPLLQVALDEALDDLKRPYLLAGVTTHIGASIGICIGECGESLDQVLAAADRALYEVKEQGKGYSKLILGHTPVAIAPSATDQTSQTRNVTGLHQLNAALNSPKSNRPMRHRFQDGTKANVVASDAAGSP